MTYDCVGGARFYSTRLARITSTVLVAACMALFAPLGRANDLKFFKNYFITGDYAVAGVGLYGTGQNGLATGTITMHGVPDNADIVAAFLYYETVETTPVPSSMNGSFDGQPIVGLALGDPDTRPCWSSGGTTGPPQAALRVYRADVLRYLAIDPVNSVRLVNGAHTVILPDSGGNGIGQTPHTEGASLVVIYRMLSLGTPYKAVVIYDGANTVAKKSSGPEEIIRGFYQASGNGGATMTQIVGNGEPGFTATLTVNDIPVTSTAFVGTQGPHWDNFTFPIDNFLKPNAASVETRVVSTGNQTCLSWGAIVTSTNVVDSDHDGLLDVWKTSKDLVDPNGEPLPDLEDMGAKHGHHDVFVLIDWLRGVDGHLHIPKFEALQAIGDTFKSHGIYLHFDVGNNYQEKDSPYIITEGFAEGGHVIDESKLLCPNPKTQKCTYTEPFAVLSWKTGFHAVKDGSPLLGIAPHFLHTWKDMFHYVLFAHALAGPFDAAGNPLTPDPASVSGVADRPGGDVMVTLGLWRADNPPNCDPRTTCIDETGTVLEQAGTLMHELGHNLGLSHAGLSRKPNCMSDYPSVMNYLYQTRGLTDAQGLEHIDYSFGTLAALNENSLSETTPLVPPNFPYRTRFYGPATNLGPGQTAAKAHCDGTKLTGDKAVRLETPSPDAIPDWDNDGMLNDASLAGDINFNGSTGDPVFDSVDPTVQDNNKRWFVDSNDWGNLNLEQVGGRLNIGGLSADVDQADLGQTDFGQTDFGQTDFGQTDFGQTDFGQTDFGDLDYDTAISTLDATGSDAASLLMATNKIDRTSFTWGSPGIGQIRTYNFFYSAQPTPVSVGADTGTPPPTTFDALVTDFNRDDFGATCPPGQICYNTSYAYFLTATDAAGTTSGPSNTANGLVKHLFVTANNKQAVYGDPIPAFDATITGMDLRLLPASAITCNLTGPAPRNVGAYNIHCTGPAVADSPGPGIDGVTYIDGTLTITPRPLTITAKTNSKTFDGNTTAAAVPVVTPPSDSTGLVAPDTVTGLAETYDNPNAGTNKTLSVSPTYTVNDGGNGGHNYTVTTKTDTTGVINTAYTQNANLAYFTGGVVMYAQFDNIAGLTSDLPLPYTPTTSIVAAGDRVYGAGDSPRVVVEFPSAVSKIRVFPNIDHFGLPYDGYQYTILGSNDGGNTYTLLFNATSVNGAGEPFTLGSFTGTPPNVVNNVLTPGAGPGGTVGYEADFVFSTAYRIYAFGASTVAIVQMNIDQELTAVGALP